MSLGIGLYLALGIVQALSAGGMSSIRRRADALDRTIRKAKLLAEYSSVRTLQLDIGRIEIGFESLHRSILLLVTLLFIAGLCPFVVAALHPDAEVPPFGPLAVTIFYIALPCLIYIASSLIISKRCKEISTNIKLMEQRVTKFLLK
jgi:hypothetical protein